MAELGQVGQQENYQFSAKPQVVNSRQGKYRDQTQLTQNIMWDKRVVRGNTYSSIVTQKIEQQPAPNIKQGKKKALEQIADQAIPEEDEFQRGKKRREHQEVQTDENVEELTNKPPNYEKECQTDFLIERELPRIYLPTKIGIDVETQIWDDGELFNFDYEVEPILQVLVGKTLETSRLEVLEEEELKEMKEQQKYYTQLRQAEMVEQERLEQVESKLYKDNQRRKEQLGQKKYLSIVAHQKLVSRALSKHFCKKIILDTKQILKDQGFFTSTITVDLSQNFIPWLYNEIQTVILMEDQLNTESLSFMETLQKSICQEHKQVHSNEMMKRQEILQQRENKRIQDEERKAQKREAKRIRVEQERRQKIKDNIMDRLYVKGEVKIPAINGIISDIDANQQNISAIGLFGGFIGELIIYFSILAQFGMENIYPSLKTINSSIELIEELVLQILQQLIINTDIQIEIPVSSNAETQLDTEEQGLTIASLNTSQINSQTIIHIIEENLNSLVLQTIQSILKQNQDKLGLSQEIYDTVIHTVIKISITNEQIRPKMKFVRVNPEQKSFNQIALARVQPFTEDLQFHPKTGKQRSDGTEPDESIINPMNIAEADIQNKTTIFPNQIDELQVLIQHSISELKLRESILEQLAETLSFEPGQELSILIDATDKCEQLQQFILERINKDIPILVLGAQ